MYWVSLVLVSLVLEILKKAKKLHLIIVFKSLGKNYCLFKPHVFILIPKFFFTFSEMVLKFVIVVHQNVVDTSINHLKLLTIIVLKIAKVLMKMFLYQNLRKKERRKETWKRGLIMMKIN